MVFANRSRPERFSHQRRHRWQIEAAQVGTEYSNDYAADLMKQGASEKEALEKVIARDIELPGEVMLHYFLYCLDLQTGRVNSRIASSIRGGPPGRAAS